MIEKAEDAIVVLMKFSRKVLSILLGILFVFSLLNAGSAYAQFEEDEEEVEEALDEGDEDVDEVDEDEFDEEEDEEEEEEAVEAPVKLTGELAFGQTVYMKRCFHCHGVKGRGDGFSADRLNPRPANFARAQYKYASTIKETLPTDEDLFRTVSKGLPGTGMPAWEKVLSEEERRAVIQYIKTFSDKFAEQNGPPKKIDFGTKIPPSEESIAKGKELFLKKECNRCHGLEGRADGPNAAELKVWPRNFTKGWTFRRTNAPEEIVQRITRGIWVMPSFAAGENVSTTIEERWHIANYVNSLGPSVRPSIDAVIRARPVEGGVPSDPNDPRWEEVR
ncbi:MAG: c-type cytochrome, partial [Nitrospiria bacterium]